jgi:hypothetical protein
MGIVRYTSVANAIARALGVDPPPEVRIGGSGGRITLTFRSTGATRWPEEKQVDQALRIAAATREVLTADSRRGVRRRARNRAIVVVFEDATLLKGCSIVGQWKCVVPADYPGEA